MAVPLTLVTLDDSVVMRSAREEMSRGVRGMLGKNLLFEATMPNGDCILLGTLPATRRAVPDVELPETVIKDAYVLKAVRTLDKNEIGRALTSGMDLR